MLRTNSKALPPPVANLAHLALLVARGHLAQNALGGDADRLWVPVIATVFSDEFVRYSAAT